MMTASVAILLAAIGELVVEKSGVLNLGVEGMMIVGAVCGFIIAVTTGSPILGAFAGIGGGILTAMLFAILTQLMGANQVATGLALTLFGLGLSSLLGRGYSGIRPPAFPDPNFGPLEQIPKLGIIFFSHDYITYSALGLVLAVSLFLARFRAGLALRATGENHDAAHALGFRIIRIRMLAIAFGGACSGLGGAYLSLIKVPQWTDSMTAGAGWIALALVVFSSWKPFRLLLGAWLFGGITLLQLNFQAAGLEINASYMSMAPYLVTIVALTVISGLRGRRVNVAPGSLGKSFDAPS